MTHDIIDLSHCAHTWSLTVATLPSTIAREFWMKKWTVVSLRNISRERVVKTFLGVSSPPVAVYTENTMYMIIVRDTIMNARLAARTSPAIRIRKDSFLQ